ncbi:gamma-D-glutamyl-L-lysine dipeptidyl-peptidase [Candidatus Velamenicoccus archaeovorus]|uniref:Gamma-D-glutamyl-L-lysine dipeptidyl-peptidase n=2 Tax=Velamenicoccus archaeovorus TaxID=1930593 RepID=A0A410P2Z4_VELA1|nr:gamma-D-glutamyl-L-lysine dipeptidyl-peptidase [Candidatus Velamenicoccus archaeovorus]
MVNKTIMVLLFALIFFSQAGSAVAAQRFMVVTAPVADLRKEPQERDSAYDHDDLQETQVLFNEVLLYKSSMGDWYYVEAVEQKNFRQDNRWRGYRGYIRKEDTRFVGRLPEYNSVVSARIADVFDAPLPDARILLSASIGTRFRIVGDQKDFYKVEMGEGGFGWVSKDALRKTEGVIPRTDTREELIETSKLFLGVPYLWGGRSQAGVDCSGLVNLVYRAQGMEVPRDAQEQWMTARKITAGQLRPADLIFISRKDDLGSIVHVMLFLGGEDFIEAPGTGKSVWITDFKNKFGMGLEDLKRQDFVVDGKKIFFGRVKVLGR